FDVEAWPTMTYKSRSVRQTVKGHYVVDGDLTIKGVTQAVPLELTFEGGATDPWGGVRPGSRPRPSSTGRPSGSPGTRRSRPAASSSAKRSRSRSRPRRSGRPNAGRALGKRNSAPAIPLRRRNRAWNPPGAVVTQYNTLVDTS